MIIVNVTSRLLLANHSLQLKKKQINIYIYIFIVVNHFRNWPPKIIGRPCRSVGGRGRATERLGWIGGGDVGGPD